MKLIAVLLGIMAAFALGSIGTSNGAAHNPCESGNSKGFLSIQNDPSYLVGTIPGRFTNDSRFFSRRFNCRGLSAYVRRVDLGIYEVKFPGINVTTSLVTALSVEGVTASAYPESQSIVRIALRGPLDGDTVAARRDVAFSIAVF